MPPLRALSDELDVEELLLENADLLSGGGGGHEDAVLIGVRGGVHQDGALFEVRVEDGEALSIEESGDAVHGEVEGAGLEDDGSGSVGHDSMVHRFEVYAN